MAGPDDDELEADDADAENRVAIPLDFEEALKALLAVDPGAPPAEDDD